MLESIRLLEAYTKHKTLDDFLASRELQDAVLRRIEIIGEAVKQLPVRIRKAYPQIPWKQIAGTRDIFIHEYFRVDLQLSWTIATLEAPKLKRHIARIIKDIEKDQERVHSVSA